MTDDADLGAAMAKQWYYQVMGSEVRPISSAELKNCVLKGLLQADTPVRLGSDGRWQTANKVKGLLDPPPAPAPRPATSMPSGQTAPMARPNAMQGTKTSAAPTAEDSAPRTTLRLVGDDDEVSQTLINHSAG